MRTARDRSHRFLTWLPIFLRAELAPYPGRWTIVARMSVAATAFAIVAMTFRIPAAYQGAAYALLVSHEPLENNWEAAFRLVAGTVLTTGLILIGASLSAGSPPLHFLWTIASFFLAFFCISAMKEYAAAVSVAVIVSTAATYWDRPVRVGVNVADTLWLCLSATVAVILTAAVSSLFAAFRNRDDLLRPLSDRLQLAEGVLRSRALGIPVANEIARQLDDAVLAGSSTWRLTLRGAGSSRADRERLSAIGALVARLIDIVAAVPDLPPANSSVEAAQAALLADAVAEVSKAVLGSCELSKPNLAVSSGSLLYRQIADTLDLMASTWAHPRERVTRGMGFAPRGLLALVPDAFMNPEHLKFALRGCLAATICYLVYNAVAWRGISSAVATCMFTALSTVGASRQKQALRLAGAVVGGVVLGMGTQVFVLPWVDSILGFTLVFCVVSVIAAWFMTCTPRLSYMGFQIAFAFDLVHLQSFRLETSLAVARDRVAGVLLGLAAMWLVFDRLWSSSAGELVKRSFAHSLRLLAQLAREPVSGDRNQAMQQILALRETISSAFDQTRSYADRVVFEFGPHRTAALEFREQVRRLQPQLRSLFVVSVSAVEYRLGLKRSEVPQVALKAQTDFDECSARILERLADEIETGKARPASPNECLAASRAETFDLPHFALLREIEKMTTSLAAQVDSNFTELAARLE